MPARQKSISKILAVKLRALGDTVILTASLRALTQKFPGVLIDVLIPAPYAAVLRDFPGIGKVYLWPARSGLLGKIEPFVTLLPELRSQGYDAVINFHASPSSAGFCRLLGARERVFHFHGMTDANRFSTVPIAGKGMLKPIIERDLDCVRALGAEIAPGAMRTLIARPRRLAAPPLLVVSPGASRATKMWPLESFCELSLRWVKAGGDAVFLLGPGEAAMLSGIESAVSGPRIRIIQSQSLEKSLELLATAKIFVGNDSGPKHLAVALGIPTFTLFGPEDPYEWHPYSREEHPIFYRAQPSCVHARSAGQTAWCGDPACELARHQIMRDIAVDEVAARILPFAQPSEGA